MVGGGGSLLTSGEVLVQPHLSRLLEKKAKGSEEVQGLNCYDEYGLRILFMFHGVSSGFLGER